MIDILFYGICLIGAVISWIPFIKSVRDKPQKQLSATVPLITLPPRLLFDWHRDYAPLWEPGSTAFWLAPEPGDLPAGMWPLPYIKTQAPAPAGGLSGTVHHYYNEDGKIILQPGGIIYITGCKFMSL